MLYIENNKVCVIKRDVYDYPDAGDSFRPSVEYPEYRFKGFVSKKSNEVYDMLRQALYMYDLDSERFGTYDWNPFGGMISPGDNVLIKPNLVLHRNDKKGGELKAVYTNPSLVAAVIDYVIIATGGRGHITVGDAPLQECVFEELIEKSGYRDMISFYRSQGIEINLKDFRNVKTYWDEGGIHRNQTSQTGLKQGRIVHVDCDSAFAGFSEEHLSKLRVPNYDPRILAVHHNKETHEYRVADEILDADVVINMPKPKTHRKAGITGALKNLVGMCSNKEFLPHHAIGAKATGGDAYLHANDLLEKSEQLLDEKNVLIAEGRFDEAQELNDKQWKAWDEGVDKTDERYYEGCWYGNDTIWRTISDLNKILYYSDKNGQLCSDQQRKVFIIADMILSGQEEGPLAPTSKKAGIVAVGENPVCFDRTVCSIMGFDYRKIPSLCNKYLETGKYAISVSHVDARIVSNYDPWNGSAYDAIRENESLKYIPSAGWELCLGHPEKEGLMDRVCESGMPVFIYGAGYYGRDIYTYIKERRPEIRVAGFFDNDKGKWGRTVIDDVICQKPYNVDRKYACIISVTKKHMDALKKSAKGCNFSDIFCFEAERDL